MTKENINSTYKELLAKNGLSEESTVMDVYRAIRKLHEHPKFPVIVAMPKGQKNALGLTLKEKRDQLRRTSKNWKQDVQTWISEIERIINNKGDGNTIAGVIRASYNHLGSPSLRLLQPNINSLKNQFFESYLNQVTGNRKFKLDIENYFFMFLNAITFGVDMAITLLKLKDELEALKNGKPVKKLRQGPEYNTLKDIFVGETAYNEAIQALQNVNSPVIDANMNYLLGERQKSAFTAWIDALKHRGKIFDADKETLATLINSTFKKISVTGKTLSSPKNSADSKIENNYTLPDITAGIHPITIYR